MRTQWSVGLVVIVLLLSTALATAQQGTDKAGAEQYVGVWSGSWEGGGATGGFELTIEKGKDGGVAGKVSVTGEPTYTATLKTLTFAGAKMSGKYDFTPDPSLEVTLEATFDPSSAKGTWFVRPGAGGTDVASGTWTVKKK